MLSRLHLGLTSLGVRKKTLLNALDLFTLKSGGRQAQNLIIFSHGSFKPVSPGVLSDSDLVTVPPGTSLIFYTPHGTVLSGNIQKLLAGFYEPLEKYMAGQQVCNYNLKVYERYDVESYRLILGVDRSQANKNAKRLPLREYDIVVPRFRMKLDELIRTLQLTDYLYPQIHSFFCRATSSTDPRYNPGLQLPPNIYSGDTGRWEII